MNDERDLTVRDTATVIVTDTVDGTKKRRRNGPNVKRAITTTLSLSDCDPRVVAAAQAIRKPGQLLRIASTSEIQVVNP